MTELPKSIDVLPEMPYPRDLSHNERVFRDAIHRLRDVIVHVIEHVRYLEQAPSARAPTMADVAKDQSNKDRIGRLEDFLEEAGAKLIAKVEVLASVVEQMKLDLFGDVEMAAKWAEAKKTGTWPAYPGGEKLYDPEPGRIQAIERRLADTVHKFTRAAIENEQLVHTLTKRLDEQVRVMADMAALLKRQDDVIEKLVELSEREPAEKLPREMERDLATRSYVDEGLQRLARALREEFAEARELVIAARRLTIGALGDPLDGQLNIPSGASIVVRLLHRLSFVWERERARKIRELAEKEQPSRIELLFNALSPRRRTS